MAAGMKDSEKTKKILEKLTQYYTSWGRERNNIIFPELRLGSGYCGVAQRRIDFFVIDSGNGNVTTSFEIKVSRQDFKKDVTSELKQRGARLYSNYFYYLTPKGLLKPEEIPIWAGLMEIDLEKCDSERWASFSSIVPAPLHAKAMPSWGLICSLVRKVNKEFYADEYRQAQRTIEEQVLKIEELRKIIKRNNFEKYGVKI